MKPRVRQMPVNPPVPEVAELASATECTGLIPSAVRTPGQAHSYAELYAIHRSEEHTPEFQTDGRSSDL